MLQCSVTNHTLPLIHILLNHCVHSLTGQNTQHKLLQTQLGAETLHKGGLWGHFRNKKVSTVGCWWCVHLGFVIICWSQPACTSFFLCISGIWSSACNTKGSIWAVFIQIIITDHPLCLSLFRGKWLCSRWVFSISLKDTQRTYRPDSCWWWNLNQSLPVEGCLPNL